MADVICGLGASNAQTATTTPGLVLSRSTTNRSGVLLCNTDTSKRLLVWLSTDFSNAPTINSTTHHFAVNYGTSQIIGVGAGVAIWVAAESSTIGWTAVEVQY